MKKYLFASLVFLCVVVIGVGTFFYFKYVENKKEEARLELAFKSEMMTSGDFEVLDENGEVVKLSDFYGKPTVLGFWASWCEPCREEIALLHKLYQKYSGDVEFFLVDVIKKNQETVESAKKFIEDNDYNFPIYFDTTRTAKDVYEVDGIPVLFFINESGDIVAKQSGSIDIFYLEEYVKSTYQNDNLKGEFFWNT